MRALLIATLLCCVSSAGTAQQPAARWSPEAAEQIAAAYVLHMRRDWDAATELWTALALRGVPHAQYHLGVAYLRGRGVRQSDFAALQWLGMAAEQSHVQAQHRLGQMYRIGRGLLAADEKLALHWTRLAAQQGYAVAQYDLGNFYIDGVGVLQSHATAANWYRQAAEQGHVEAMSAVGVLYGRGLGVPKDYALAHMWFNLASRDGHAQARGYRDRLAAHMSPEEISAAQQKAAEFTAVCGTSCEPLVE